MRIIFWNCQGAFRKKNEPVLDLEPDILCVQEIEHPSRINFSQASMSPTSVIWDGEKSDKGVAVYSFNGTTIKSISNYNKIFRHVLPVSVDHDKTTFNLFNVWTKNRKKEEQHKMTYIDYVICSIPFYEFLSYENAIFCGDFNADKVVTTGKRFEKCIDAFKDHNLESAYYRFHSCKFSDEKHPTSYFHRNKDKPFHIDYAFCSEFFLTRLKNIEVGTYDDWVAYSDHVPVIIDFDCKRKLRPMKQKIYDAEIDISTDIWLEMLMNEKIFYQENLDFFKVFFESKNHESRGGLMGKQLNKHPSSFNGQMKNLADRIRANYPDLHYENLNYSDGKPTSFNIPFHGRGDGHYFWWKLRPELVEACKIIFDENKQLTTEKKKNSIIPKLPLQKENHNLNIEMVHEGKTIKITTKTHQRSLTARNQCIEHYGYICKICGFEFGKFYGEEFKNKIEVHHLKPLSEIGEVYKINPIKDLVPVCSNCHVAIHSRKNPPYTPEEIKELIDKH